MKYGYNFRRGYRQKIEYQKKGAYKSCRGKVRFETEDEASNYNKTVIKIKSRHHERIDRLRLYHCGICDGFHFTSKLKQREIVGEEIEKPVDKISIPANLA